MAWLALLTGVRGLPRILFGAGKFVWGVESPCLGGFAGDFGALFGVEGFGNAVQVQAFLPDLLEEVCDENRFRHTPGGNESGVFPVAESTGCEL